MFILECALAKRSRKTEVLMAILLAITGSFGALLTLHVTGKPSGPEHIGLRIFGFPRRARYARHDSHNTEQSHGSEILSQDDKRRIDEEELYRAKIRRELGPVETTSFINRLARFVVKAFLWWFALVFVIAAVAALVITATHK